MAGCANISDGWWKQVAHSHYESPGHYEEHIFVVTEYFVWKKSVTGNFQDLFTAVMCHFSMEIIRMFNVQF